MRNTLYKRLSDIWRQGQGNCWFYGAEQLVLWESPVMYGGFYGKALSNGETAVQWESAGVYGHSKANRWSTEPNRPWTPEKQQIK